MSVPDKTRLSRTELVRDTVVFQVKLAVDGLLDLLLVPVSLVAAGISFLTGDPAFYQVMRTGRRLERRINLFGAARRFRFGQDDAFDKLALRVEQEIRNELESHRLQTSAKAALERAMSALKHARNNDVHDDADAARSNKDG